MKKGILIAILVFNYAILLAQIDSGAFRTIELPATIIKPYNTLLENSVKNSEQLIQKKDIQKLNTSVDVPYLLNQTPATVVGSDAGTGVGYTNIRIRGADISRINVSINGIPVNDAEGQGVFFVNFADILGSANSMSIQRGIGTSKSGYGNFGGAIAINNLDIDYKKPMFSFMTDYGSFNTFKTSIKGSTGLINNKYVTTIRLSRIVSDGFIERSAAQLSSAQISAKYFISPSATLTFNYMGGKEKTGQAWYGVSQSNLDTARNFNELGVKADGSFYNNQTDNYQQDYFQLFFDDKLKNIDNKNGILGYGMATYLTKGKGYYEEYKLDEMYTDYYLPNYVQGIDTIKKTDLIRQLWLNNNFYGLRAYLNYFGKKTNAGLYLNTSRYDGLHYGDVIWAERGIENDYRWYNLDAYKKDNNIYGMFSYQLSKNLQLFADVQYRNVQYVINGFRKNPDIKHNLHWNFINPKVELSYVLNNKTKLTLFVAQSSKEPNRDDFEVNPAQLPKPEQLTDYEFNWKQQIAQGLHLHTTLYYMNYKNQLALIGQINDVGAYVRNNIDKSYRTGIELQATYQYANVLALQANLSLSRNKIQSLNEIVDNYDTGIPFIKKHTNTDISFSPGIIVGGQISIYPLRNNTNKSMSEASIDIIPKYVSRQYLDNTQNKERSLNPFSTTDLLINFPIINKKGANIKMRLGLMNIFNELYESSGYTYSFISERQFQTYNYYYPQAGIRYNMGIGFEF